MSILPQLRKALQYAYPTSHAVVISGGRGDAMRLVAERSKSVDVVVAVGGDGTIHEVVNGMFGDAVEGGGTPVTRLAVLSCGTGGDFAKSVSASRTVEELMESLEAMHVVAVDVGRVLVLQAPTASHWFINVLSYGASCETIRQCDRMKRSWMRFLGGKITYMVASTVSLMKMKLRRVRVMLDRDGRWTNYDVCVLAIANGKFFGGGMAVSPGADPTDRMLNVTIWREGLCGFLCGLLSVYNGQHVKWSTTVQCTARVVDVEALDADAACVMVDSDGELCGNLPISVSLSHKVMLVTRRNQSVV